MLQRLHALVVPGLVALVTLAYWVQVSGARRTAILVPMGIIALIVLFAVIVVVRDMRRPPPAPTDAPLARALAAPAGLIVLSIGYGFAFQPLGFDVANVLFLGLAFRLMGGTWSRGALLAVVGAVVLHGLARLMKFDLPDPFWTQL